ncbi:MAG: hypothetical protein GXX11_00695 [Acholeplasmataceae bacterium]|nr:hypothetical protein [Acholeplasmataceae bacterium]
MKIGVIGPQSSINLILGSRTNLPVEFLPLPYTLFTEALEIVKKQESTCDALLFTGQTPYRYVSNQLHPTIPWEYLPRNILSTMCALVRAGIFYHNIHSISMDGFDDTIIKTIYNELQLSHGEIKLLNANFNIAHLNYLQHTLAYHIDNYRNGKADLCITGLQFIYDELQKLHIPTIKTNPNFYMLQEKLEMLVLKRKIVTSKHNYPTIIAIRPELKQEYADFNKSELLQVILQAKITESVYAFAQRLGAAVFQDGQNQYYLFTNQQTLAAETNNWTRINLLYPSITAKNLAGLSIGIGIGHTCMEAKNAAEIAQMRSTEEYPYSCYVINEKKELSGPLNIEAAPETTKFLNQNLMALSDQTNIGISTLKKIEQVLIQYHFTSITPSDLAHYCQISLRSMNRILQNLEQFGYVTVIGKKPRTNSGRPSRIIWTSII